MESALEESYTQTAEYSPEGMVPKGERVSLVMLEKIEFETLQSLPVDVKVAVVVALLKDQGTNEALKLPTKGKTPEEIVNAMSALIKKKVESGVAELETLRGEARETYLKDLIGKHNQKIAEKPTLEDVLEGRDVWEDVDPNAKTVV